MNVGAGYMAEFSDHERVYHKIRTVVCMYVYIYIYIREYVRRSCADSVPTDASALFLGAAVR